MEDRAGLEQIPGQDPVLGKHLPQPLQTHISIPANKGFPRDGWKSREKWKWWRTGPNFSISPLFPEVLRFFIWIFLLCEVNQAPGKSGLQEQHSPTLAGTQRSSLTFHPGETERALQRRRNNKDFSLPSLVRISSFHPFFPSENMLISQETGSLHKAADSWPPFSGKQLVAGV